MDDADLIRLSVERLKRQKEQVEALKDTLLRRDAALLQLRSSFEALQDETEGLRERCTEAREEAAEATEALAQAREETRTGDYRLRRSDEAFAQQETKWKEMEEVMRVTVRRFKAQAKQAARDARKKDDDLHACHAELRELRAEQKEHLETRASYQRLVEDQQRRMQELEEVGQAAETAKEAALRRESEQGLRLGVRLEDRDAEVRALRENLEKQLADMARMQTEKTEVEGKYQEVLRQARTQRKKAQDATDQLSRVRRRMHELARKVQELEGENAATAASEEHLRKTVADLAQTLEVEKRNRKEWATARSQLLRQFCETDTQMKGLNPAGTAPSLAYNHAYSLGVQELRSRAYRDSTTRKRGAAAAPESTARGAGHSSRVRSHGSLGCAGEARSQSAKPSGRRLRSSTRARSANGRFAQRARPSTLQRRNRELRGRRAAAAKKEEAWLLPREAPRYRHSPGVRWPRKPRHRSAAAPAPDDSIDDFDPEMDADPDDWAGGDTDDDLGGVSDPELHTDLDAMSSIGAGQA